jgi:excisionase family DNA binding protein
LVNTDTKDKDMEATAEKKFLTPAEYALRTGVSGRSVRRWCEDGLIRGTIRTPGGHYRIPAAAVDHLTHDPNLIEESTPEEAA